MRPAADKPRLAITMGDPGGVGPELCLRVLAMPAIHEACVPIVLGDAEVLARVADACDLVPPQHVVSDRRHAAAATQPTVYDRAAMEGNTVLPGAVNAATGAAAYRYVEEAIDMALAGEVGGITTAPIHKEALRLAGIRYAGHTEMLIDKTGASRACMMLTSDAITCSLVTTHVGLGEAPGLLTEPRVLDVIELTADAMQRLRGHVPRLIVCGVNPHSGEHGLFGQGEEERIIAPAVKAARRKGIQVDGPVPPDTAFLAECRTVTDAYVCMYHDQGLIPLKMLAFDRAVNITLGLPIIRTSADHGTALNIAWQGKASPSSLIAAVRLAAQLATTD